jgi:2,5-furandicarboxylate decarboxylase 1
MATRLNPQTGITVIENTFGHGLNPSFPDYLGHKVGFDACRPVPFRYEHDRAFTKKMTLDALDIASKPLAPPQRATAASAPAPAKPAKSRKAAAAPSGGQAM